MCRIKFLLNGLAVDMRIENNEVVSNFIYRNNFRKVTFCQTLVGQALVSLKEK